MADEEKQTSQPQADDGEEQKPAPKKKSIVRKCTRGCWRLFLWVATIIPIIMILVNLIFWGGIWWVNNTASGQNFLKAQIGAQAAAVGEYDVDFDGLFYIFPAQIRIAELHVTQNEQLILSAEKIFLGTQKISFLEKHIAASFLAGSVTIYPTPETKKPQTQEPKKPIAPVIVPEISLKNDYFDTAQIEVKISNLVLKSTGESENALAFENVTDIDLKNGKIDSNLQVLGKSQTLPDIAADIKYDALSSVLNIESINIKHSDYEAGAQGVLNFREGKSLTLNATARINTIPDLDTVKLSVTAQNTKELPITIKADSRYQNLPVTAGANIDIKAETININNINATLPDLNVKGTAKYNLQSSAVTADISGTLKSLKPYRRYVEAAHVIDPSTFSASIKGQKVNIKVNVPAYRNKAFALGIKDIDLSANITDQLLTIETLKFSDEENGRFDASGTYDITQQAFDFSALAKDLDIVKSNIVKGTISADIKAKGNMQKAAVTGTITPGKTVITLPDRVKTSVPQLNVVKQTDSENQPPEQVQNIKLDLVVNAKNQIFVVGYGLDAEFGGKLKITGTADKPLFNGNLNIIRGRFEQFGKRFSVSRGKLIFSGPVPPSPFLDIVVETKADDIIAKINIDGNAVKPEIGFTSDPPLPADEVMAKVLFGRSLDKISPFQAAQIAQALSGNSGGASPMSTIKSATGLDDIRVDTSGSDTLIGAGAYLSDNVYLDIESGTEAGSTSATVEIELTPNIKVESKVGQDAQGGAGIFWEFDY